MASVVPELPVLARDQAFEALYRLYVKDVYHYALALLRNPADAEDVTQTTFLNAYRAYRRGDEIEKPQNWLIKIAHNVARSRYARARRRVKEVPLEEHVEQLAVPEEERPNVEGVLHALGRLPFNQRAALVMRELEGRSYAEIADTIGVSVSAVETLIFRARRSLRLRASALRSLAAVPLPKSLTQLFGGGGVVTTGGAVIGGAAVVGSGFIAKATIALLAGAVATGISWNQIVPETTAASKPAERVAAASVANGSGSKVQSLRVVRTIGAARANDLESIVAGGGPLTTTIGESLQTGVLAIPASAVGAAASAPTGVPAQVATEVTNAVSSVEQTATNPAVVPVQAPSVPPLPVQVPSRPPPVQVPSLPPPVQVPSLPPPLQLPSLPSLPIELPPPPSLP